MAKASPSEPTREVSGGKIDTEDRIISAAYRCFAKYGIAKTTIEDIARAAGITRPTVYKYFPGKNDIINHISLVEAYKLHNEVRRRGVRRESLVENIVEALFVGVRVSSTNMYIRRVMESVFIPSISGDPAGPVHRINREWWRRLIEEGVRKEDLASDLTLDEIVSWLSLSQSLLLIKIDAVETTDAELRKFISRFIMAPLLARPGQTLSS